MTAAAPWGSRAAPGAGSCLCLSPAPAHGMLTAPCTHTVVVLAARAFADALARAAAAGPALHSTPRYSAPFREQVQSWVVKLSTVSEILEQWLMVQVRPTASDLPAQPPCAGHAVHVGQPCPPPACLLSSRAWALSANPAPHSPHPAEHVAVHGGGVQRRRHRQAAAGRGQALSEY